MRWYNFIKAFLASAGYFYYFALEIIKSKIRSKSVGLKVHGPVILKIHNRSTINVKDNVSINSSGLDNPIALKGYSSINVKEDARLTIGYSTSFSQVSIWCSEKIEIGDNCVFGAGVMLWDTDFHELNPLNNYSVNKASSAPIYIGNNVFIGANVLVLKGSIIGDRAIIGANSVVRGRIGSDEIWIGNPAVKIR